MAIAADSSIISGWVSRARVWPGWQDIADTSIGRANFGDSSAVSGPADELVVSLGDGGYAEIYFNTPLKDGPGPEFAIFENSFSDTYLELALVEVSSNGQDFVRFPAICLSDTSVQIGSFGSSRPEDIFQLAGKYRARFGQPFDLVALRDSSGLRLDSIVALRIIDVVGHLKRGSRDSRGFPINDPYPTAFASGGFDLDAVALLRPSGMTREEDAALRRSYVYPNPAREYLSWHPEVQVVELYHSSGKRQARWQAQEQAPGPPRLRVGHLPKGLYLLRGTLNDGSTWHEKVYLY